MEQKVLFNEGWLFSKTPLDVTIEEKEKWQLSQKSVAIPHDFLIEDTRNLYEDGIGWYEKTFEYKKDDYRILLNFDGIYMDSVLYINDKEVGQWKYGYSPVTYDITDFLEEGTNSLLVKVVHRAPNSRWYSGAGIYRNIWLLTLPKEHILPEGVYVHTHKTEKGFVLSAEIEVCPSLVGMEGAMLRMTLMDREQDIVSTTVALGEVVKEQCVISEENTVTPDKRALECGWGVPLALLVEAPVLWDVENPYLYGLRVELLRQERVVQTLEQKVGFCTKEFSPERGFFLNGRKLRINGVCEHHDLGALGAAFSKEAMARKLRILKKMGVNGLRTSHNMPAKEVMELADEMGFLVVAEAFDMWEREKTPYDYARFFKDWAEIDIRSFVRRDRSHVCLLMWSIGNEIYDTHADAHGEEITRRLKNAVEKYDYRGNGRVTIGSNYMGWQGAQNCADITGFAGYNYGENLYEKHHREHPDWIIYGSETASVIKSRGIYHFPLSKTILTDDDEQCSSLGNSCTSWGAKNEEYCITMDRDAEYSCGQFLWTGFDYIGEPTPYQTKNSYFGQIDTAGFPKDAYYIYKAEWTDYHKDPFVHIFPYWDFNEGQQVDVRACSNAPRVQIYVNGEMLADKSIDHGKGKELLAEGSTTYKAGSILAVALDENGREIAREERVTPGDGEKILLSCDRTCIKGDGQDLCFVEIKVVDQQGHEVDNDNHYVEVEVTGAGRLVGLDNGDSTDYDSYKGTIRKLFSGKLMAMVASNGEEGTIQIVVRDARESRHFGRKPQIEKENESKGEPSLQNHGKLLMSGRLEISCLKSEKPKGSCLLAENSFVPLMHVPVGFVPIRKLELCSDSLNFGPERTESRVIARVYPKDATEQEIIFKAVTASGIESNLAIVESKGNTAVITARGDGDFYIRAMVKNGTDKVKLISQMECHAQGLGRATIDPYQFVTGGLFTHSRGGILTGLANGASTARGESAVGYAGLDFGEYGSDEVTLSIFANSNSPQFIQIYEGMPGEEGSSLLYEGVYHKKSIWQVFQEETYHLNKKLKGVTTLSILTRESLELGGFVFARKNPALEVNYVADNSNIYGDAFTVTKDAVENIGNNVSISYEEMDFGQEGITRITICGKTPLPKNTIHIRFVSEDGNYNAVVEFPMEQEYMEHTFELEKVCGKQKVNFIFLPGSKFDFKFFRFS